MVANFAITQVSNRGLGFYSQPQTDLVADLQGWFSGSSASATQPPPANDPPPQAQVSYSQCTTAGLASLNATRAASGVAALASNANAQAFACSWALQLAIDHGTIAHSNTAVRDATVGCPTGENIASATGASSSSLISMWHASPAHLANIKNSIYRSAGLGFVVRTDAAGQTIYGSTVFAIC